MRKKNLLPAILLAIAVAVFFFGREYSKATTPAQADLRVWFLDVGQGDSIFIRTADDVDILIDGGPDSTAVEKLAQILPVWDHQLDYVFLTHPHADHLDGLIEVLRRYEVKNFVEPGFATDTVGYEKLEKEISFDVGKKIVAKAGDFFDFGSGVTARVVWPQQGTLSSSMDTNDSSIVLKLSYGNIDFLLTGDATTGIENNILDQDLDSEFLKVAHHGSRYASSTVFLQKVTPLVSFISVGEDNTYGHPTKDALERLWRSGSRVIRTDKSGTVEVDVDRTGRWKIVCEYACD